MILNKEFFFNVVDPLMVHLQDKQDLLGVVFLDEEAVLGFELFGSGSFV